MRRVHVVILVLMLAVVACGDDDAASTTAVTTTAAATTTTGAPATTVDAVAARVAAAQAYAGSYSGEWNNTTFGSSGSVEVVFTVDAAAATASLVLDLGGSVFGSGDPDPVEVEFDLTADGPYAGTSDLFGDFTVAVDGDGHLVMTAPSVPGLTGMKMVTEGDFTADGFAATYVITHPAGSTFAEGTMTAQRAG
jgi:hypothetical protein